MTAEMEEYHTLTRCQKLKKVLPKVLPLLLLSVILPTADVWTDLVLITKLYKLDYGKIASSLLFFFLLNYVMGLVTCIRLEGRKWVPLITALLTFYPQYCKELILNIYNFVLNTNIF